MTGKSAAMPSSAIKLPNRSVTTSSIQSASNACHACPSIRSDLPLAMHPAPAAAPAAEGGCYIPAGNPISAGAPSASSVPSAHAAIDLELPSDSSTWAAAAAMPTADTWGATAQEAAPDKQMLRATRKGVAAMHGFSNMQLWDTKLNLRDRGRKGASTRRERCLQQPGISQH